MTDGSNSTIAFELLAFPVIVVTEVKFLLYDGVISICCPSGNYYCSRHSLTSPWFLHTIAVHKRQRVCCRLFAPFHFWREGTYAAWGQLTCVCLTHPVGTRKIRHLLQFPKTQLAAIVDALLTCAMVTCNILKVIMAA